MPVLFVRFSAAPMLNHDINIMVYAMRESMLNPDILGKLAVQLVQPLLSHTRIRQKLW